MPNQQSDDHIPAIILDQEDIKPKSLDDTTELKKDASEKYTTKPSIFPVILTLCVFSISAWFLYQQNSFLLKSQSRIESLENQLSATGEEIGSSAVAMQVKVQDLSEKTNELWKQMDKLWASAWRRNQNDIADLRQTLNQYKTLQVEQKDTMNSILMQQTQLTANFNKQNAIKAKSIQELKETLLEFEMKSSDRESHISGLNVQLHNLKKQFDLLNSKLAGFESKLKTNSTDIKTIQP